MARIRSVKPDFWEDEKVGRVPRDARLLWIAIWNQADDVGRFRADPRLLSRQAFPYDSDALEVVVAGLAALSKAGLIRLYVVEGQQYGDIPNFLKHQRISKPQPSKFPKYIRAEPTDSRNVPGTFPEDSTTVPEPFPVGLEGNGREGNGEKHMSGEPDVSPASNPPNGANGQTPNGKPKRQHTTVADPTALREVFDYWKTVMGHPRVSITRDTSARIAARLSEGRSVAELKAAIRGARRSAWHRGDNPTGTKYDKLKTVLRDAEQVGAMIAKLDEAKVAVKERRWQERDGRWWVAATAKEREGILLDMGPVSIAEWDAAPSEPKSDAEGSA